MSEIWREEYRSSMKKWGRNLWDLLNTDIKTYRSEYSFILKIWRSCGFCYEHNEGICDDCPLYPEYCDNELDSAPYPKKILDAWLDDNREKFEKARRAFVRAMAEAYRNRHFAELKNHETI